VRGFRVGDFERATSTMRVLRSQHLGQIGLEPPIAKRGFAVTTSAAILEGNYPCFCRFSFSASRARPVEITRFLMI
jgi:hypothetical protein